MDDSRLNTLLHSVQSGELGVEQAKQMLSRLPFSDLGYARVDHHRELRLGLPEVVFGENKSVDQIVGIVGALRQAGQGVLVTRLDPQKAEGVRQSVPDLVYREQARILLYRAAAPTQRLLAPVALVTAGTSDQPVAEEAAETLAAAGVAVDRIYDAGVAGLHRLLEALPRIQQASAVICVAGMEGALPSVLGGLVGIPVIAVPTSVGYGVAFDGLTALFGMLTSCASGVTVVNIDNGFGAAMAVLRMSSLVPAPEPGGPA